jgi:hypothetical protein
MVGRDRKPNDWSLIYSEHAWENGKRESGFVDLILELDGATFVLVIERKRVLETTWVFLNREGSKKERRHAKVWVSNYVNDQFKTFDWVDITPAPYSTECE